MGRELSTTLDSIERVPQHYYADATVYDAELSKNNPEVGNSDVEEDKEVSMTDGYPTTTGHAMEAIEDDPFLDTTTPFDGQPYTTKGGARMSVPTNKPDGSFYSPRFARILQNYNNGFFDTKTAQLLWRQELQGSEVVVADSVRETVANDTKGKSHGSSGCV